LAHPVCQWFVWAIGNRLGCFKFLLLGGATVAVSALALIAQFVPEQQNHMKKHLEKCNFK